MTRGSLTQTNLRSDGGDFPDILRIRAPVSREGREGSV